MRTLSILLLTACVSATQAYAQPRAAVNYSGGDATYREAQGGDAIPALPLEEQVIGDIHYLSGGVSDEELSQLKAQAGKYNLHVLMNAKGGEYISEATVHITGAKGSDVLSVDNAGPYLYVALTPGTYAVEVTPKAGVAKKAKVKVAAKGVSKLDFVFEGD